MKILSLPALEFNVLRLSRLGIAVGILSLVGYFAGLALESPAVGMAAILVGLLTWVNSDWALLVFLALVPLVRSPQSAAFSPELMVGTKAVLAITIGLIWWIRNDLGQSSDSIPTWVVALIVAWVGIGSLSLLNGADRQDSISSLAIGVAGAILFSVTWKSGHLFHKKMMPIVIAMGALAAIVGVLQFLIFKFHVFPTLWRFVLGTQDRVYMALNGSQSSTLPRASGTFYHPNQLGSYLSLIIPFAAACFGIVKLRAFHRIALGIVMIVLIAGLLATNSRAAYLAVFISLSYIGIHRPYRALIKGGLAGVLVIALWSWHNIEFAAVAFKSLFRPEYGLSSRGQVWRHSLELIERHPWLGVGPGNFAKQYFNQFGFFVYDYPAEILEQPVRVQLDWSHYVYNFHAHNAYLQVMGEYGLFALPLFVFGIGAVIWNAESRARRLEVGSFGRSMALGAASFCASYLVACYFDAYVVYSQLGLLCLATPLLALGLHST
jgi:O-antigen ligase